MHLQLSAIFSIIIITKQIRLVVKTKENHCKRFRLMLWAVSFKV